MLTLHSDSATYDQEQLAHIRSPWWLKSTGGGARLVADFEVENVPRVELSFDVKLPAGISLLSADASTLRQEIWDFLCLQGEPSTYGSRSRSRLIDRRLLLRAGKVVDYFLLRADKSLAMHGFRSVPASALVQLLIDVGKNEVSSVAVYDWIPRLTEYIRAKAISLSDKELDEATDAQPRLAELDVDMPRLLELDDKTLVRARAAIFHMGMTLNKSTVWNDKHRELVNVTIQKALYLDTLLVPAGVIVGLKLPSELRWGQGATTLRELPGAPIAQGRQDKTCSRQKVGEYRQCVLSWRRLSHFNIGPSPAALADFARLNVEHAVNLKDRYGVEPLPPPVVALALRNAMQFFYEHQQHLLASTARVLLRNAGRRNNQKKFLFQTRDLSAKTRKFGVSCWSSATESYCTQQEYVEYVRKLREDRAGLLDMVRVLYGACLTIVGALEAARQGELLDLRSNCLDQTREWVALLTRKTGYDGVRHEDFIPAPALVADVIEALATFLKEVGQEALPIFSIPTSTGLLRCDYRRANYSLDLFCDYFQVPCDDQGRRYYIRQHQLRKFFASLFFHCCGFAGLDTLRWFLRHIDAKHLWNYIRGITPAEQMRYYMAKAGVLLLRRGASEMDALTVLLRTKFGVSNFEVVSDKQLRVLLEELQVSGEIEFELIFGRGLDIEGIWLGVLIWGDLDE